MLVAAPRFGEEDGRRFAAIDAPARIKMRHRKVLIRVIEPPG